MPPTRLSSPWCSSSHWMTSDRPRAAIAAKTPSAIAEPEAAEQRLEAVAVQGAADADGTDRADRRGDDVADGDGLQQKEKS